MSKWIVGISLTVGSILQGLAMSLFLFPHAIPSGGAAGIAIIVHVLHKQLNFMPGKLLFIFNSVIFLSLAIVIDWLILIYALITQFISAKVIDLFYKLFHYYILNGQAVVSK